MQDGRHKVIKGQKWTGSGPWISIRYETSQKSNSKNILTDFELKVMNAPEKVAFFSLSGDRLIYLNFLEA